MGYSVSDANYLFKKEIKSYLVIKIKKKKNHSQTGTSATEHNFNSGSPFLNKRCSHIGIENCKAKLHLYLGIHKWFSATYLFPLTLL